MLRSLLICGIAASALVSAAALQPPEDPVSMRKRASSLFDGNNFAEALEVYRDLLEDGSGGTDSAADFGRVVDCLRRLNRENEVDAVIEETAEKYADDWRVLQEVGLRLLPSRGQLSNYGYLIGGEFRRGNHRGGGEIAGTYERDRVRALQIFLAAIDAAESSNEISPEDMAILFDHVGEALRASLNGEAWRLQELTDITTLPDYEEGFSPWGYRGGSDHRGAPVTEEGEPVLYAVPESWEAATNDGERWRWTMQQQRTIHPPRSGMMDYEWAQFLHAQFGVAGTGSTAPDFEEDETGELSAGPSEAYHRWKVQELSDDETVANLATGTERLSLPAEYNHITILKQLVEADGEQTDSALTLLASIYRSRLQFARVADIIRTQIRRNEDKNVRESLRQQRQQILGKLVSLETVDSQLTDEPVRIRIRFRNAANLTFSARTIRMQQLMEDSYKAIRAASGGRLNRQSTNFEGVAQRLLADDGNKYVGETAAEWTVDTTPAPDHFDTLQTVTTPLDKAGVYLIRAEAADGNSSECVVWVQDTAIVRKQVTEGSLYYLADASDGAPVSGATLQFFGFEQQRISNTRDYRIETNQRAAATDEQGLFLASPSEFNRRMQWSVVATTPDGRMAFHGFRGMWNIRPITPLTYAPIKVYTITDRPLYRPKHEVKFRTWVRQPRFHENDARFADQRFIVEIRDPRGDVVEEMEVTSDRWGGIDGEWTIPDTAVLGSYQLRVCEPLKTRENRAALGVSTFRVEEYRKPEFEVAVESPERPVMLGEKIRATVRADYFFGAPVSEAEVHYKVTRTRRNSRWYPSRRWDWLYGNGYWWFTQDYNWYPGWNRWGCMAPLPPWRGWVPEQPEVILEGDGQLAADGTLELEWDTAGAADSLSDSDHNYSVEVEVTDKSRRTIRGSGSVLVARRPFNVFIWQQKGLIEAGSDAEFGIRARTADGKPVAGQGTVTLYKVTYPGDEPVEEIVDQWPVTTDAAGKTDIRIPFTEGGQYRLSCQIDDGQDHQEEGATVLYVRGDDEGGRGFRFNDLELIADKAEYQPLETVRLQIRSQQTNARVLVFIRSENGICPLPKVVQLSGKTGEVQIPVSAADYPNFYVEAMTVTDGRVASEAIEIVVPPAKRVADVEVLPSATRYRPGEEATVRLKLTGPDGRPFVGNTVLSVYDASLEAIAASSIPEIQSFFWKIRRNHNPRTESTLGRRSQAVHRPNVVILQPLWAGYYGNPYGGRGYPGGGMWDRGRSRGMMFGAGMGGGGGRAEMYFADEAMMADGAMPAPAAAALGVAESAGRMRKSASSSPGASEVEPTVRSEFADTAYWLASADAGADGVVEVKFRVPDNLTTWKIRAWTLGDGSRVGSGTSDIISSKDLLIRPQLPRFVTETDRITLSAVVHNYLSSAKEARVSLETEGGLLRILDQADQTVRIDADGEVRVDWEVQAIASGEATVRMFVRTDEESDAAELKIPVQIHGSLRTESFTGIIRGKDGAEITLQVPADRIEQQSELQIRFSPTLAGAMLDAIPYLTEYPYGCTEQTLNRFLPALLARKSLQDLGYSLEDLRNATNNLNSGQRGDLGDRIAGHPGRTRNPVFDQTEVDRIVREGISRLMDMQLSDGGWGWFSGYGERSSAHLTSQVVRGLTLARESGAAVPPNVLERGVAWLRNHQQEQLTALRNGDLYRVNPRSKKLKGQPVRMTANNQDALTAFALAMHDSSHPEMHSYLFRDRGELTAYGLALSGLVMDKMQDVQRRDALLRNIDQFLQKDEANQTAWLLLPESSRWSWYGSENEAMAMYLKLLLTARPQDSTASELVKYLINNRRQGGRWDSTRDTALVVESFTDYLKVTSEGTSDIEVEVRLDGDLLKRVRFTQETLLTTDNLVTLTGDAVRSGNHQLEIRRSGDGPLYWDVQLTVFSQEERIEAAGLETEVDRRYYRLIAEDGTDGIRGDRGQVVDIRTQKYRREPLTDLSSVRSGELIEVELLLNSRNDYEYLLLEDFRPSGFEAVDQLSGYVWKSLRCYREFRDNRTAFFIPTLMRGEHSISYRMRAEAPAVQVSALPAKIEGMYAPELVGNSDEIRFRVADREGLSR